MGLQLLVQRAAASSTETAASGPSGCRVSPQEERLPPTAAIRSVYDDDDDEGRLSYGELSPEARGLVDLHRDHRHARATGKEAWAADLEEEMHMMRFRWGEPEDGPSS